MNAKRLILTSLFIELLALAAPARAYDIDIYSTMAISTSPPNIMIVIDNPSSQNNAVAACTYYDGTTPSNNGQALGADQCALVNLVHNLATRPDGTAQLALGLTTMSGVDMPLTPVDDNTYTGVSPVIISGVSVTIPGGTTNRNALILAVKAITQTTGKSGQGSMLQETWAYYTGGNGTYGGVNTATGLLSNRTYPASGFPATNAGTGCQKNYIIYLSNVKAGASHAQTWTSSELSVLDAAAHNAVTSGAYGTPTNTTNPTFLKLDPSAAGYTGTIAYPTAEAQYGLEWARFMYATDINNVSTGLQTIVTYSIGTGATAAPGTAITNNMEQYIDDVAIYGGGKYYPAGTDPSTLQNDILKIFNEVQAVNSVFASSSLPVSVNAQGTFLNQVYMGMFRPDPNGLPRWFGNLKQYQFGLNQTTNSLFLADSLNNPAISSAGTGFISPNAISFWTCTALGTSPYPDPFVNTYLSATEVTQLVQDLQSCADPLPNGFWANNPDSTNAIAHGFDLADGERVERGGTAQQIRSTNLVDNYTFATETTQNPRQLYTWCPSGSGCSAAFENASPNPNVFDTANAAITDALLGTGAKAITSITSAATVSLGAFGWAAPFGTGGANPTITILSVSKSSSTVTATVSAADLAFLWVGAQLKISTGSTKYDCNPCTVASINTTNNTFTYSNSGGNGNPTTPSTAAIYENYVEFYSPTPHGLTPGMLVTISGCTTYTGINGLVGAVSSQWIGSTWFVIAVATPLTFVSTDSSCKYTPNTATVTTSAPHGLSPSEVATIAGATPAGFNGSWVVTPTGNYTFTYQYTSQAPLTPNWTSAGATVISSTITRDALTKWVRGDDNFGDEPSLCPPGTTAGTGNCPATAVTVRPSVHGDVLHSRPTVLNYGYSTGNIISTADSGTTRTATLSATDVTNLSATGFSPVITFANGDACAVTIASGTTVTYQNLPPPNSCGNSGAQTITFGSKVVVYYGDNGGVFHAVNGNRSQNMGQAGPGDEIWGFIPKEFFSKLMRLMANSPMVQMPSTPTGITPAPTPKDWFVDGAPGTYQVIDGNGNTVQAIIYLAMRRGTDSNSQGFMYALDVTSPLNPKVLWKIDSTGVTTGAGAFTASTANAELGQTWSQPKVAFINGYCNAGGAATPPPCSSTNLPSPVLIMGGGYDPNEDSEPITTLDTQGRAIFILDALTGKVIWSVSPTGSNGCAGGGTTPPCHKVMSTMVYSIPADITLVDRDNDGNVDRLYATDTGGNVWRVDLEPPKTNALSVTCNSSNTAGCTPDIWTPYQIAALGGFTGPCYGTLPAAAAVCNPTQRKFFYPAEVITATSNNNFDAVIVGSGDREHPLYVSTATQRYNRIFLLKDVPGNDGSIATTYPMTVAGTNYLLNCAINPNSTNNYATYTSCLQPNGTDVGGINCMSGNNGYYVTLGAGEKVVNAPLVVAGIAYMSTNTPSSPTASCIANLGVAKGYGLSPFACSLYNQVFAGGGLPPSPVAGVVDVVVNGVVRREPFLIGGVNPNCVGSDCSSAEGAQKPPINVPTTRHRNYRYIKGK